MGVDHALLARDPNLRHRLPWCAGQVFPTQECQLVHGANVGGMEKPCSLLTNECCSEPNRWCGIITSKCIECLEKSSKTSRLALATVTATSLWMNLYTTLSSSDRVLLMPHRKPQLDPLAKIFHKLFSLSFQKFFHLNPGVQSFKIISQIKCFSRCNRQSSAYHSMSAAEYPESQFGSTVEGLVRCTSDDSLGHIIGITNRESEFPTHIRKIFRHRSIHDPGRNQVYPVAQILHLGSY